MEEREKQIPIWFFIGAIVLIYGALITATGFLGWVSLPPAGTRVALWELHADLWWGLLLLAIGLFYSLKYRPRRKHRSA
ncbi:MAG: hypothetical protein BWY77_01913 [bacterium ADurb.Bin431]|nr:MAG: hypothetical protein BWY77_01913 [bacterium ADurb.Bin431]